MLLGFAAVSSAFGLFIYVTNNKMECRRFKRNHPGVCAGIVFFGGYVFMYILGSVVVFLFGIALPLLSELNY